MSEGGGVFFAVVMGNEQSKDKGKKDSKDSGLSIASNHQTVTNQLDDAPVYCFDQNISSPGLVFSDNNQKVKFHPNSDSLQVAYINARLKLGYLNQTLSVRAKLEGGCSDGSIAVLGFGKLVRAAQTSPADFYLLNVTQRKVYLCDEEVPNVRLPSCGDGDIIEWQVDIGRGYLSYKVSSNRLANDESTGNNSMIVFEFDSSDVTYSVYPMFGMLSTGGKESSFHILQVSRELTFNRAKFDIESVYGPATLSSDCLTVSRDEDTKSNCCALINRVLREGRHRWRLKVLQDVGASLCLGIAAHPLIVPSIYGNSSQHIYLHNQLKVWRSYGGLLYSCGQKLSQELCPLECNDEPVTVEFILDLSAGTLSVIREGVSLGVAFKDIKPPVQPVVVFYAGYRKQVQLVSFDSEISLEPHDCPIFLKRSSGKSRSNEVKKSAAFDSKTVYGSLTVSTDGMTLERERSSIGNAYCLINQTCTDGVYCWSFKIKEDEGASTCLGIATEPIQIPNDHIYASKSMYLYRSYMGKLYLNGSELSKEFEEFWMPGSVVELVLDMGNGVLQIIVNGINQGVCFCNLKEKVYRPVVAFYAGMVKSISLQKFEHFPPAVTKPLFASNNLTEAVPIEAKSKENGGEQGGERTDMCMTCGVKDDNVIFLPCKHAVFCANHANVGEHCIVCEQLVESILNVF